MEKKRVIQVQESQRVPYRIDPRRNMPRHILNKQRINTTKKILKAAKKKQQLTSKGNPICLTADLSVDTLQGRRKWQTIVKVLERKNLQPRSLYPARILFKTDGEIKSFSDKQS